MMAADPVSAVLNQSTPLEDYDGYRTDRALVDAVAAAGGGWADERLREAGRLYLGARTLELGRLANENPPVLATHDRQGRPSGAVEFHPAWHELLAMALERGMVSLPWKNPQPGSQVARAALLYLHAQAEAGTACPLSMSYAAVPVLSRHADAVPPVRDLWLPGLLSDRYDPRDIPAADKSGLLLGMGMTERQGGSDVRRTITRAEPERRRGTGAVYAVTGHKWFMSAPMCDAFLVLAQTDGGIACFLVPRLGEDGSLNGLRFLRLKDKLGNRSNASSEVEFHGARGLLIGEEGRGIATIIEMASHTRLDCVLATAGLQRRCLAMALHHAGQREAFGRRLVEQPLMVNVIADMAVEAEAATRLAMLLARCFDREAPDAERALGRLLTPAAKLHVCKRGAQFAAEAMEVVGGNGYVEDHGLARLYREMPLLSIWEGSGNVMCLDVLRVLGREPAARDALRAFLARAGSGSAGYAAFVKRLDKALDRPDPSDGRRIAHAVALAVQAALLFTDAPGPIADAYCRTRLAASGDWGASFGTLPPGVDTGAIIGRAVAG